jgi:4'-phosphopantetheinyl transferase
MKCNVQTGSILKHTASDSPLPAQPCGRYSVFMPESCPGDVVFSYGSRGKPELAGEPVNPGLQFNLSHSDSAAILAVTKGPRVGVDVERIRPEFGTDEVAQRFFAAGEVQRLQALQPANRADAFFACWTRKEAYIKALGEGLSVPLDSFEVAFGTSVPARLLAVKNDPGAPERWSLYDIAAPQGFKAALMAEGKDHQLSQRVFEAGQAPWPVQFAVQSPTSQI